MCCEHLDNEFAQHFRSGGFKPLREHLHVGGLLLTPPSLAPPSPPPSHLAHPLFQGGAPPHAATPELCWQEAAGAGVQLLSVNADGTACGPPSGGGGACGDRPYAGCGGSASSGAGAAGHGVRLRVAAVPLSGGNVLDRLKRWATKRGGGGGGGGASSAAVGGAEGGGAAAAAAGGAAPGAPTGHHHVTAAERKKLVVRASLVLVATSRAATNNDKTAAPRGLHACAN